MKKGEKRWGKNWTLETMKRIGRPVLARGKKALKRRKFKLWIKRREREKELGGRPILPRRDSLYAKIVLHLGTAPMGEATAPGIAKRLNVSIGDIFEAIEKGNKEFLPLIDADYMRRGGGKLLLNEFGERYNQVERHPDFKAPSDITFELLEAARALQAGRIVNHEIKLLQEERALKGKSIRNAKLNKDFSRKIETANYVLYGTGYKEAKKPAGDAIRATLMHLPKGEMNIGRLQEAFTREISREGFGGVRDIPTPRAVLSYLRALEKTGLLTISPEGAVILTDRGAEIQKILESKTDIEKTQEKLTYLMTRMPPGIIVQSFPFLKNRITRKQSPERRMEIFFDALHENPAALRGAALFLNVSKKALEKLASGVTTVPTAGADALIGDILKEALEREGRLKVAMREAEEKYGAAETAAVSESWRKSTKAHEKLARNVRDRGSIATVPGRKTTPEPRPSRLESSPKKPEVKKRLSYEEKNLLLDAAFSEKRRDFALEVLTATSASRKMGDLFGGERRGNVSLQNLGASSVELGELTGTGKYIMQRLFEAGKARETIRLGKTAIRFKLVRPEKLEKHESILKNWKGDSPLPLLEEIAIARNGALLDYEKHGDVHQYTAFLEANGLIKGKRLGGKGTQKTFFVTEKGENFLRDLLSAVVPDVPYRQYFGALRFNEPGYVIFRPSKKAKQVVRKRKQELLDEDTRRRLKNAFRLKRDDFMLRVLEFSKTAGAGRLLPEEKKEERLSVLDAGAILGEVRHITRLSPERVFRFINEGKLPGVFTIGGTHGPKFYTLRAEKLKKHRNILEKIGEADIWLLEEIAARTDFSGEKAVRLTTEQDMRPHMTFLEENGLIKSVRVADIKQPLTCHVTEKGENFLRDILSAVVPDVPYRQYFGALRFNENKYTTPKRVFVIEPLREKPEEKETEPGQWRQEDHYQEAVARILQKTSTPEEALQQLKANLPDYLSKPLEAMFYGRELGVLPPLFKTNKLSKYIKPTTSALPRLRKLGLVFTIPGTTLNCLWHEVGELPREKRVKLGIEKERPEIEISQQFLRLREIQQMETGKKKRPHEVAKWVREPIFPSEDKYLELVMYLGSLPDGRSTIDRAIEEIKPGIGRKEFRHVLKHGWHEFPTFIEESKGELRLTPAGERYFQIRKHENLRDALETTPEEYVSANSLKKPFEGGQYSFKDYMVLKEAGAILNKGGPITKKFARKLEALDYIFYGKGSKTPTRATVSTILSSIVSQLSMLEGGMSFSDLHEAIVREYTATGGISKAGLIPTGQSLSNYLRYMEQRGIVSISPEGIVTLNKKQIASLSKMELMKMRQVSVNLWTYLGKISQQPLGVIHGVLPFSKGKIAEEQTPQDKLATIIHILNEDPEAIKSLHTLSGASVYTIQELLGTLDPTSKHVNTALRRIADYDIEVPPTEEKKEHSEGAPYLGSVTILIQELGLLSNREKLETRLEKEMAIEKVYKMASGDEKLAPIKTLLPAPVEPPRIEIPTPILDRTKLEKAAEEAPVIREIEDIRDAKGKLGELEKAITDHMAKPLKTVILLRAAGLIDPWFRIHELNDAIMELNELPPKERLKKLGLKPGTEVELELIDHRVLYDIRNKGLMGMCAKTFNFLWFEEEPTPEMEKKVLRHIQTRKEVKKFPTPRPYILEPSTLAEKTLAEALADSLNKTISEIAEENNVPEWRARELVDLLGHVMIPIWSNINEEPRILVVGKGLRQRRAPKQKYGYSLMKSGRHLSQRWLDSLMGSAQPGEEVAKVMDKYGTDWLEDEGFNKEEAEKLKTLKYVCYKVIDLQVKGDLEPEVPRPVVWYVLNEFFRDKLFIGKKNSYLHPKDFRLMTKIVNWLGYGITRARKLGFERDTLKGKAGAPSCIVDALQDKIHEKSKRKISLSKANAPSEFLEQVLLDVGALDEKSRLLRKDVETEDILSVVTSNLQKCGYKVDLDALGNILEGIKEKPLTRKWVSTSGFRRGTPTMREIKQLRRVTLSLFSSGAVLTPEGVSSKLDLHLHTATERLLKLEELGLLMGEGPRSAATGRRYRITDEGKRKLEERNP
jgi:Mn-dependent DtxR family transcriptional regulator/DNA-binding PadR family transcriptional regulator